MKETKLNTQNKHGETLVGIKTQPDTKADSYPTVILVHGFHVTKSETGMFDELARQLADTGIMSYRFDFSGCGESEGDFSNVTLTKLKDDLYSILECVKHDPQVDNSKIGILAQSFGSPTAIALQPDVATLILLGTSIQSQITLANFFGDGYNPKGISRRKRSSGDTTEIKPKFWDDLAQYNFEEIINNIHCPILFIHGSNDEYIPVEYMKYAYNHASEPKEKIVLKGEPHWFDPKTSKMYDVAVDWMKKHL